MKTVIEIEWQTDEPPEGVDLILMFRPGYLIADLPAFISSIPARYIRRLDVFEEQYADNPEMLVKRSGVLGWALWPLGIEVNPETGELVK